jgi:ribosomal protein S18 acetylase RimI-like enzyme
MNVQRIAPINISIRSARPEDAPFLAWVILVSGRAHVRRGIWEAILGGTEGECLAFLQLLTVTKIPHLFHYSCFFIAEANGRPVAGLGGYDPRSSGYPALRQAINEVIHRTGFSAPDRAAMERSQRILSCIPEDAEGAWVIDSAAAVEEFRRQGIMGQLLEKMLEKGREQGFRCAQINIYIGNLPAQKLYEKHGFKVVDEKRHSDFEKEIGSPGMARLVRDL